MAETDLEKGKFSIEEGKIILNTTQFLQGDEDTTDTMNLNDLERGKFIGDTPNIRIVKSL